MDKKIVNRIISVSVFVLLAVIVSYLLPRRKSNFAYDFEKGKPWSYDLLTAERDFPIYKTEAEVQNEREQVLKSYTPFYNIDSSVGESVWRRLDESEKMSRLSRKERERVEEGLRMVYSTGVLPASELDILRKTGCKKVKLVDNRHVAQVVAVADLYTPKTAYAAVNEQVKRESSIKVLDLNSYIRPNLIYDTIRSEKLYSDLVSSVSLTHGLVQKGERIIDRGEIVTEDTYQVLVSLRKVIDEKTVDARQSTFSYIGMICLVCLLIGMLVMYLFIFRPHLLEKLSNVIFICLMIALLTTTAAVLIRFTQMSVYIVPFALVPMMLRVFYDSRTAFFCHLITVLLVALMVPSAFTFIMVQTAVGLVTVVSLKDVSVRAQLVATAAYVFLTQSVVYTACCLALTGTLVGIDWYIYVLFLANALLLLLVYGLIYVAERGFGFTSALTLVELTNVNSGLLLDFARKAPGTFQHALQVSNLATEAAKRINANALLVRVGALYHDIGKMLNPEYFIENQSDGINPLSNMDEKEAARIIISHVEEGMRIAEKKHLPSVITSFIATHHGTSKVRYFYNKYVNSHPDEDVDPQMFMYPGPKPRTKETGILMMADAVEARSRSLTEMTEESIAEMVEKMVSTQIADGELSETPLSLKDVEDIKHVFTENLCAMNHHRIVYPELKTK